MFDQISPRYDLLNHLLSLNTDVLWRRRAAEALGPVRRALDVCCGTGDLAVEIHRRWRAAVVGIDFAGKMLDLARKKAPRLRFLQGDALRLPFSDAFFDAVTVAFGIRNVTDPARGISEMARVLRPGGRLAILEFTLPRNRILRSGYLLYFTKILPRVGKMIARSDAYRYLPDSVQRWFEPEELAAHLVRAGLKDVRYEMLSLGVAALHLGTKPTGL